MSWDIVLFSSEEKITSVADLDEEKLFPVSFDNVLLDYFENKVQTDNHVTITEKDFEIDFLLDEEPVSNKMISLYGENALFSIIILAKREGWQIYDSGLDGMIDLNDPANNGYEKFTEYKNSILNQKN